MKRKNEKLAKFFLRFAMEIAEITLSQNNDFSAADVRQFEEAFLVVSGKYNRLFSESLAQGKIQMDKDLSQARGTVAAPFNNRYK